MLKIQFCSGGNILEGFTNHDADVDISKPLPYADVSVDFVFVEHGAEHITHPQCLRFFREIHRILKPGGVFRLCIPVLDRIESRVHTWELICNHGHQGAFTEHLVYIFLRTVGFSPVKVTNRQPIDGHWKVIGVDKDDLETYRIEATK